jgi:nucleoside-diphosphate kinase
MLTLVLFKPDCVRRGLVGECLSRFERRGFYMAAIEVNRDHDKTMELLKRHYEEHADKPFFPTLMQMMLSRPLVACALGGRNVIAEARRLAGPFKEPIPGTIRGDFATSEMDNVIHTSADLDAAQRELAVWFPRLCDD